MSREVVVRVGAGPLHIRTPGDPQAICGHKLPEKLTTWPRGRMSAAVWDQWKHCPRCDFLNRMWTGKK